MVVVRDKMRFVIRLLTFKERLEVGEVSVAFSADF